MRNDGIKASLQKKIDFQKIERLQSEGTADVLVGFLAGRPHAKTDHRNPEEKYTDYDGDTEPETPMDTAELARDLHFGTATIPARPFLEEGIAENKEAIKEIIGKQLKRIINGEKANWNQVGTAAVGGIQEFVRGGYYKELVPNSKRTIEYKGSDTPLIDGGDLINALTFLVEEKTE